MKLTRHPLSALFSQFDLAGEELDRLTADIRSNGLQHPIILLDDKVLDGWNRYTACKKAKVEPITIDYEGDDPWGYVVSSNIARRHMTTSQIAAVYLLREQLLADGVSGVSKDTAGSGKQKKSVRETAKELGIPAASAQRLKAVEEHATPEVKQAVIDGSLTLGKAAELAKQTPEKQLAAMRGEAEKPAPVVDELANAMDDFDPIAELEIAQAEIQALQTKLAAILADDAAAELAKYVDLYQTSQARLNQEMAKNALMDKELRRFGKLHAEIRKVLNLDDDRQLLSTIKTLAKEKA